MGAYNWVIIEETCPVCGRKATIRCQTHVASSYGGGPDGRFLDREYRLGERMRWWAPSDPEYPQWRAMGRMDVPLERSDQEACYSTCRRNHQVIRRNACSTNG